MAKRAVRGLADLSDFEDEVECLPERQKSVFDTKVYTDEVLEKIRIEEDRVVCSKSANGLDDGKKSESNCSPTVSPLKTRKRRTLVVFSDSSDSETESAIIVKVEGAPRRQLRTRNSKAIERKPLKKQIVKRSRQIKEHEEPDELSFLERSVLQDSDDSEAIEYRILVRFFNSDKSTWVRLTDGDSMQKVFNEVSKIISGNILLMIDINDERREVSPEHTPKDFELKPDICCIMHAYLTNQNLVQIEGEVVKLRFVTSQRRQTREMDCGKTETFQSILSRYCEISNLSVEAVKFQFDGDSLPETSTPADFDMDTGDQIEVHS